MKKKIFDRECAKMRAKYGKGGVTEEWDVIEVRDSQPEKPLTPKEAALRLGRTEGWTRSYFKQVAGTLKHPSLDARRGTRKYITITIPINIFERERAKFQI